MHLNRGVSFLKILRESRIIICLANQFFVDIILRLFHHNIQNLTYLKHGRKEVGQAGVGTSY